MDILGMLKSIIENAVYVVAALIVTLFQRWLLGLSTPEKDKRWAEQTAFGNLLYRLRWYRGVEFFHQLRAKRLLSYTYEVIS